MGVYTLFYCLYKVREYIKSNISFLIGCINPISKPLLSLMGINAL